MNQRHLLNEMDEEILSSCKAQLKIHIEILLERNVRSANIQIELDSYIKSLLKQD
jgi:hypothetical protein